MYTERSVTDLENLTRLCAALDNLLTILSRSRKLKSAFLLGTLRELEERQRQNFGREDLYFIIQLMDDLQIQ